MPRTSLPWKKTLDSRMTCLFLEHELITLLYITTTVPVPEQDRQLHLKTLKTTKSVDG